MYLYELVNWLTTIVDSLVIKEVYKDEAYKGALQYIADCLMVSRAKRLHIHCPIINKQGFLTGRDIPLMNENAISNILVDVDFLEDELKRIGRSHLSSVFVELRLVGDCISLRLLTFFADLIYIDYLHSADAHGE